MANVWFMIIDNDTDRDNNEVLLGEVKEPPTKHVQIKLICLTKDDMVKITMHEIET